MSRAPERVRCSWLIDWPVYPRLRGTMLTTTPKRNAASKSNRSDAVLDRLRATRTPGESYSDVILRLVGMESSLSSSTPPRHPRYTP